MSKYLVADGGLRGHVLRVRPPGRRISCWTQDRLLGGMAASPTRGVGQGSQERKVHLRCTLGSHLAHPGAGRGLD